MKISQNQPHGKWHLLFLPLFLFLPAGDSDAEKIYKYVDENGVPHFSNICPDTNRPLEIRQIRVDGVERRVQVNTTGTQAEPVITVLNQYGGPIEVEFRLLESMNVVSDPPLPARVIVDAASNQAAVQIRPIHKDQTWSYKYNYRFFPGSPRAKHLPRRPYRPPFQDGCSFRISQGFKGDYSHKGPQNKYAIDIAMPEGTPVCAARGGVVMDIANDFFGGGTDKKEYKRRSNYIRILHDDGTMAIYAHLKLETICVGIGKRVYEGEIIAESGNTGFTSGPHLHFAVQRNAGMQLVSVPFKIEGTNGQPVTPVKNMLLDVN